MPIYDRDYMKPSQSRGSGRNINPIKDVKLDPVLLLIIINVAIYIACLVNQAQIVRYMGLTSFTFTHRPWTLITYMFVHNDFWQIFGNVLILFFFGRVVYKLVGSWKFLAIFFAGGIAGGLVYLWLGSDQYIIIGAYGAVYALMGALVVIMPTLEVRIWFILPVPLWVTVLITFLILTLPSFFIETLWQPFVGGLVVGLIAGFIYRQQMKHILYR